MHKKIAKAVASSLMAAAMLATAVSAVVPMSVSAGNMLGESTFDKKGLPWHTCETSPAKQKFGIKDGTYQVEIVNVGGEKAGGESRWDLQFRHRNLKIKAGHKYKLHAEITADHDGEFATHIANLKGEEPVWLSGHGGTQAWGFSGQTCSAGHQHSTNSSNLKIKANQTLIIDDEFTADHDLEVAEWAFHYGGAGGQYQANDCFPKGTKITFDNMTLECETCPDGDYSEESCNWDQTKDLGIVTRKNSKLENNFISVNQVGYFTKLSKKATLGDNAGGGEDDLHTTLPTTAQTFELLDESGKSVYTGTSQPGSGTDKDSGDNYHILDFSDFTTPGTYTLKCGEYVSMPFKIGDDIFSEKDHDLLTNAMNYYYQNRSGVPIKEEYITSCADGTEKSELTHQGGHNPDEAYVQPKWQKAYAGVFDGDTSYKIDGTGGWYDAGDHGKYVVNGGISVWTLQNIFERNEKLGDKDKFKDGSGAVVVPEVGNGAPDILDETKVELDWMMKMIVSSKDPAWGKYEGLVYQKLHDHKWTGLGVRPETYAAEWETTRIVKPPTFAATLNFVACAAQAARLWEPYDAAYSKQLLDAAKSSYAAYKKNFYEYGTQPGEDKDQNTNEKSLYAPMDQAIGGGAYGDTNVKDDAYWAASELYATTGDATYYDDLKSYSGAFEVVTYLEGGENNGSFGSFNWGNTASCGSLSLYLNKDKITADEASKITSTLTKAADTYIAEENSQAYGIPYRTAKFTDPVNIGYDDNGNLIEIDGYEWGSNSFVINNAIIMAYAYDDTKDVKYINGVSTAMDYLLGRNPLSYSYVTGYGTYALQRPHHRLWSKELDKTFPLAPDGILSGGPGSGMQDPYIGGLGYERGKLNPQRCYVDSIEAWSVNEVTINWNAPLVWVTSFLQDEAAKVEPVPPTPTNPGPTDPKPTDVDPTDEPTDPPVPTGDEKPAPTDKELVDKAHWGDVNEDEKVNIADAVALSKYLVDSNANPVTKQGLVNANCQYDEYINGMDSTLIVNYSAMLAKYETLGPQNK